MKKLLIIALVFLLVSLSANFYFFSRAPDIELIEEVVSRDTVRDTVVIIAPPAKDSSVVRKSIVRFPVSNKDSPNVTLSYLDSLKDNPEIIADYHKDSVDVEIPITQKIYEGNDYRAYISGYDPKLDSLLIFRQSEYVKIRSPTKPPRFSVGLQAGYGITPKGFQPYVGVGITVNLWSR